MPFAPPTLRALSLATAALAAGCGSSSSPAGSTGTAASATPAPPSATVPASAPSTGAPPVDAPPPASALPAVSAAPPASAIAPSSTASASAAASAKPPKTALADAGAPSPSAVAAVTADAGAPSAGAPTPGKQVALQVDAIFAAKKTFSAHFDQQHTMVINGKVENTSGTVTMERPGKISFRYDPPTMNRIVCDGTTLKAYIASEKTMYEKPMGSTPYPGVLAFMMGGGIAGSFSFTIKTGTTYTAGTVLEAKPLVPEPSYENVVFFIRNDELARRDPGAMERVLLLDAQGNKNRFTFSKATQPASIDPAEFTFTPPPGTTVQR